MFAGRLIAAVAAISLFQSLAVAGPVTNNLEKRATTYLATFDDITQSDPAESTQAIDVYKSLYWQSFNLDTLLLNPPTAGVVPHSGNQYALDLGGQGTAQLTCDYTNSKISYFHLTSFYYACISAMGEGQENVPTACTIVLTGYDENEKQLATQSFTYSPTGLEQQMTLGSTMSSFQTQKIYTITVTVKGDIGDLPFRPILDSVAYTVYKA